MEGFSPEQAFERARKEQLKCKKCTFLLGTGCSCKAPSSCPGVRHLAEQYIEEVAGPFALSDLLKCHCNPILTLVVIYDLSYEEAVNVTKCFEFWVST